MLMTKKELYTSPEVDVLEIKFEGVICQSGGNLGSPGLPGAEWTPDDDFLDFGIFNLPMLP